MDTKYIEEFIHLAQTCNFQETAADFYISQSSLTKHIQAIETELGVPLFNRTTRKCTLTKYGHFFQPYASQVAKLLTECTDVLSAERGHDDMRIDIGGLGYMQVYGMYQVLSAFVKAYPDMRYNIIEGRDSELKDMLAAGTIQFVLTPNAYKYPKANTILWIHDSFVLLCPSSHPFAKLPSINIKRLQNEPLMIHGQPVDYSSFFSACNSHGFQPEVKVISFNATISTLVESNHGLAVVNRKGLSIVNCSKLVSVPIVPESGFDIHLIYNTNQKLTSAGKSFLSFFAANRDNYLPSL